MNSVFGNIVFGNLVFGNLADVRSVFAICSFTRVFTRDGGAVVRIKQASCYR